MVDAIQRERGAGQPSVPDCIEFLPFLVAKLFAAIKASLALFSLPLRTGTDQPRYGAGQEGRLAQQTGPPWTSSQELHTLVLNSVWWKSGLGDCE